MNALDMARSAFRDRFSGEPAGIARAPGRVNLLGEHVDYNDGFVLPAAINRATYLAFRPARGGISHIVAADLGKEIRLDPRNLAAKTDAEGRALPDWALYPGGVAWALQEATQAVPGLDIVYSSDVPRGSGLSSSASVEMAFATAWQSAARGNLPPMELALLSQRAENKYAGVQCGIMDQFASACGQQGHALLLDCRSLEWQTLPLPADIAIIIADTTVRHAHAGGDYNKRRASCEEAVRILSRSLPGIRALRDVSPEEFRRLADALPEETRRRARYIVEEIERMRSAPALLAGGDIGAFGLRMNECHAGLRDLYEVSCPELDVMAALAQSLPGCLGARMTGGGFGGCTANLVETASAETFAAELSRRYEKKTGFHPDIYICQATDGAGIIV
jgi:galactokinase